MPAHRKTYDRANRIMDWFLVHQEERFNKPSMMEGLGETDSAAFRRCLRLIRDELAPARGLCFPTTCPQEGSTYVLTARGAEVVDSTLHLDLIERGIARRRTQQQDFILADIDEIPLTNQERVFFEQKQRTEMMRRDLEEMDAQMTKAILADRKARRQAGGSE